MKDILGTDAVVRSMSREVGGGAATANPTATGVSPGQVALSFFWGSVAGAGLQPNPTPVLPPGAATGDGNLLTRQTSGGQGSGGAGGGFRGGFSLLPRAFGGPGSGANNNSEIRPPSSGLVTGQPPTSPRRDTAAAASSDAAGPPGTRPSSKNTTPDPPSEMQDAMTGDHPEGLHEDEEEEDAPSLAW